MSVDDDERALTADLREDTFVTSSLGLTITRRTICIGGLTGFILLGCAEPNCKTPADDPVHTGETSLLPETEYPQQRKAMVREQLRSRDISDPHVLRAMDVPRSLLHGSIRFSLSRYNTNEDIDYVLEKIPQIIGRLRELSPFVQDDSEGCNCAGGCG